MLIAITAQVIVAASAKAQRLNGQIVRMALKDASILEAFKQIESQTDFRFMYRKSDVGHIRHLSLPEGRRNLAALLDQLLQPHSLSFRQMDNKILIQPRLAETPLADTAYIVSGRVTGDDGNPVIGATVIVKGTGKGAISNEDGQFSVSVTGGAVLVVTSLGYRQMEFPVKDRGPLALQLPLQTGGSRLNEVIVVGYGTRQKRVLSGSIGKVGALKPEENMVNNPISALQGRVAGLSVSNTGATPGSMPNFTIRGVQTIQNNVTGSGSNPLIVVDGLVIDAAPSGANANFSMFNLNPQDIASIEVLKDAASSAMYGARGAQGVILITTKKGSFGARPVVNINAYTGFNMSSFSYRPLNSGEYAMMFREARQNRIGDIDRRLAGGVTPGEEANLREEKDILNLQMNELKMGPDDFNWLDKVKPSSAPLSNIQLSIAGGSNQTSYYFSFGKYGEANAVGDGRLDRYSGKLALTQKVNRWLKAGMDVSISKVRYDGLAEAINSAIAARPDTPDSIKTNPDGTWDYWNGFQEHPYGILRYFYDNRKDNWNYTGNFFAEATLNKNFSFRSMIAGSRSESNLVEFMSPHSYGGLGTKGDYQETENKGMRYTLNNVLTYRFSYSKLKGDALLGQEFTGNQYRINRKNLQGFPMIEGLWKPANASISTNYYNSENRLYEEYSESYFVRSNMSWNGKYLLSMSLRRDGTSKLKKYRQAWFPAISGGWIVSDENFLRGNNTLSYLKVRSSFGITGNIRPVGHYDTQDLVNSLLYLNEPALRLNTLLGNPNLKWERTRQHDIGLETRFFNDRLSITAEYYVKKTDGLLTSRQIPWSSGGFTSQRVNLGAMTNRGLDLAVSVTGKPGAFHWEVSAVANINRNRVTELRDSTMAFGVYFPGSPMGSVRIGQPLGLLQLYQSEGVDPQTGDLVYTDMNKDGKINQQDMVYIPVALPKVNGGLTVDLGWKGFSLNTQLAFNFGNSIYNFSEQFYRNYDFDIWTGVVNNKPTWVLDRWQKPGDAARYPRAIVGEHGAGRTNDWNLMPSTHYIYSGSFVRCRNVTLAYNLPNSLIQRAGFQQVRVYAATQNLFTIKDQRLNADDPEQGLESGLQRDVAPLPRAVSFGIDLRF
ncbi:SusC/RagA family TonB-linked outer membrane protein [Chitinophaga rhizosphaerae]|uniref:SusC/RagA family TonB-linked outer membrane protein n=1 Tax=Chitinophaga rhizosphaerae TaxID=1864947 RepID=UPI0013DECD57|nr:SusC/RagA family TonB-linked outer membrane protein [Chitinophaga rhizosphaerae]